MFDASGLAMRTRKAAAVRSLRHVAEKALMMRSRICSWPAIPRAGSPSTNW